MTNLVVFKGNSLADKVNQACDSIQIKNCDPKDIGDVLLQIFALIGLKEPPSAVNSKVLVDYIKRNLGNYRLSEFVLAYEMAINGQLVVDITHYQEFSPAYLAGIMRAYKKHTINMTRKEFVDVELTEKEKENIIIDGILNAYEEIKKGNDADDLGNAKYNYLDKRGIIKFTSERKWDIHKKAKEIKESEMRNNLALNPADKSLRSAVRNFEEQGFCSTQEDEIIMISKKIALNDYLKDCAEMDIDLNELLS